MTQVKFHGAFEPALKDALEVFRGDRCRCGINSIVGSLRDPLRLPTMLLLEEERLMVLPPDDLFCGFFICLICDIDETSSDEDHRLSLRREGEQLRDPTDAFEMKLLLLLTLHWLRALLSLALSCTISISEDETE